MSSSSIFLKIIIALISAAIAILGIYSQAKDNSLKKSNLKIKDRSDRKSLNIIIYSLLALTVIFTTASFYVDYNDTREKDELIVKEKIASTLQHKSDSLLNNERQDDLHAHIESMKEVHKSDSVQLVICNSINNYKAKNMNVGVNNGQIGDNTIVHEKELSEKGKTNLMNRINQLENKYNYKGKEVNMIKTQDSNGGKYSSQIESFLKGKGFNIIGHATALSGNVNGIEVSFPNTGPTANMINILVGTL